ncbi:helix-turn-helix transcriptional regulator [Intrasporangium sp. YIM S08009]|uniref:helix-turn-helix domain-containing protein n=1 Tax=Intrasporangium zincisolvens TaxID=3080018 RepID=UPI002B0540B8|nr:helix-turn-helix transcriptional regulator [Intrasporangium sp. YIM S08009]
MTSRPARPVRPPARRRGPLLRHVYGGLIRGLRLRQGRTLAEVAGEAGISVAYLSEVERGLKEPSSEVLDAVCRALGSSITHLIGAAHRQLLDLTAEAAVAPVLDLTTRIEHQRSASSSAAPLVPVTPPATGARASFVLAS